MKLIYLLVVKGLGVDEFVAYEDYEDAKEAFNILVNEDKITESYSGVNGNRHLHLEFSHDPLGFKLVRTHDRNDVILSPEVKTLQVK